MHVITYLLIYRETGLLGEGDREAARKTHLGFRPLVGDAAGPLRLRWSWGLGGVADHGLSLARGFLFLC
jgi:hypothetical protein